MLLKTSDYRKHWDVRHRPPNSCTALHWSFRPWNVFCSLHIYLGVSIIQADTHDSKLLYLCHSYAINLQTNGFYVLSFTFIAGYVIIVCNCWQNSILCPIQLCDISGPRLVSKRLTMNSYLYTSLPIAYLAASIWLDAGFSSQKPEFNTGWLHARFKVEKWHWSRFSQSFFHFPLLIDILSLRHTHLPSLPEVCDSPDHAAQYHILGL
jgi:hypothetical protein